MNITVNLKKVVVVAVLLLIAGGSVYWWNSGADKRLVTAEYKQLLDYANRQAVEIAIIEQTSKLADYRQQMAKMQQAKQPQALSAPVTFDPNDVKVK